MINLIPMAGLGNRFFQENYNVPKPFVPVLGVPMFIAAAKSFPKADKTVFVCRKEHSNKYKIREKASLEFENVEVVEISGITEGQACTCLLAEDHFDDQGLYIASCDYQTVYDEKAYEQLLNDDSVDVIIWTFSIGSIKSADPNAFAYCKEKDGRVIEVVEKRTISGTPEKDPAVVGSFTYKNSDMFSRSAKAMIKKDIRVNGEFYVATSINQLIEEGLKVVTFPVQKFISFGNPFEFNSFLFWEDYFHNLEDHPYKSQSSSRSGRTSGEA